MSHKIKVTVTDEAYAKLKRRFPRGGLQILARAAWHGQQIPILPDEERRELAAIQRNLLYVGQELNQIIENLDLLLEIRASLQTRPEQFDPKLAETLTAVLVHLMSISRSLGSGQDAVDGIGNKNQPPRVAGQKP